MSIEAELHPSVIAPELSSQQPIGNMLSVESVTASATCQIFSNYRLDPHAVTSALEHDVVLPDTLPDRAVDVIGTPVTHHGSSHVTQIGSGSWAHEIPVLPLEERGGHGEIELHTGSDAAIKSHNRRVAEHLVDIAEYHTRSAEEERELGPDFRRSRSVRNTVFSLGAITAGANVALISSLSEASTNEPQTVGGIIAVTAAGIASSLAARTRINRQHARKADTKERYRQRHIDRIARTHQFVVPTESANSTTS